MGNNQSNNKKPLTKLEIIAQAYNVDQATIQKSNKTKSSKGSTSLTSAMITCKQELEDTLFKHCKKYKITQYDTSTNSYNDIIVYGFLDKHPSNEKLHCIRTFNFFAPYKDKSKLVGEAPMQLIEQINE